MKSKTKRRKRLVRKSGNIGKFMEDKEANMQSKLNAGYGGY